VSIRDRHAFAGVGVSRLGRIEGRSATELAVDAIEAAVADAGIDRRDLDGYIYQPSFDGGPEGTAPLIATGLPANFVWQLQAGSTTGISSVIAAVGALEAGLCKACVVLYATSAASHRLTIGAGMSAASSWGAHGFFAPVSIAAGMAQRYRHNYGMTDRQLGQVAVTLRSNANRRPEAVMHERPLSIEEYLAAPYLVEPLRKYDCCLVNDGAVALIVTSAARARDLRQPPVYIMGYGLDHSQARIVSDPNGLWHWDGFDVTRAKAAAFGTAGIDIADVDVAMMYDAFSMFLLAGLEAWGFCGRGEAAAFVADGHIAPGGSLPCNTSGTALSWGYMQGFTQLTEGVRQMRGEGGATQVRDAEICLVTGLGGSLEPAIGSSMAGCVLRR
jgi:acetyl-CoA acetyltransferase